MKSIQYITDKSGNKTAVVLPIKEFEAMQRELDYGIPEWHVETVKEREKEKAGTSLSWNDVLQKLDRK